MRSKLLSMVVGAAAVSAAVLVSQIPGVAQAAPLAPLASPAGSAIPTNTGNSDALFGLTLPVGANCPNDGPFGYRAHTFIAPIGVDVASLTWSGAGAPVGNAQARNLFTSLGAAVRNLLPVTAPVLGGIPGFSASLQLSAGGAFGAATPTLYTPGVYQVGVACGFVDPVDGIQKTEKFYASRITITANTTTGGAAQVNFAVGEAPNAPVLTGGAVTVTTAALSFTQPNSAPASTYTVQVTPALPAGGTATISGVVVGASSTTGIVTLTGATTDTDYTVNVTAANGVTPNAVSNGVVVRPIATPQPAITPTFTPGVGEVTIGIPAVTIGGARTALPTSYTLAVSPAPAAPGLASYTIPFAAGPLTQVVAGVGTGTASIFTLTVSYAAPNSGPGGTVSGSSNSAQILQQRITVTRPLGQLILTQRCGVNGDIPNFTGTAAVPGFPTDLPAIVASATQTGTSPDISPAAPGLPANAVDFDSEFGVYPFPLTPLYPTECGISLGTSTIVTSGAGAGLYFQADGFIREVTVSDTRDSDGGWALSGRMNNFRGLNIPSNTINGNWMGWVPQLQNKTANQTITTGGTVLPGTGVAAGSTGPGLGNGRLLGSAGVGAGLGVTQFDARLLLLIPTNTPTDNYVGLLDFTII